MWMVMAIINLVEVAKTLNLIKTIQSKSYPQLLSRVWKVEAALLVHPEK
jgi:hypothetical protein